ncbi:ADP-ribosylation factor GTPase-activating protein 3, partial [Eschrichtius robustus]|nr:ADP-ribosylation factor GTPase-activating protein 3 [Eschrichtius robustus]
MRRGWWFHLPEAEAPGKPDLFHAARAEKTGHLKGLGNDSPYVCSCCIGQITWLPPTSERLGRAVPTYRMYFDEPVELRSSSLSSWDDSSDSYWKKETIKDTDIILKTAGYTDRPARRKPDYEPVGNTDEAQKKFGNVKAISSDMYFGRQAKADYETRARLERLSASSSISSADLFDEQRKQTAGNYNLTSMLPTAPDMAQFKQGVRSVAGKLSVFANGVMTSIQDRYGS